MADLVCSPGAAVAYDFLIEKGLRDFQAAAVIGNLQWESKLNPKLEVPDTDKFLHRGIAMWDPTRWQNLLSFSAAIGRDPLLLDTQLEFLWYELGTDPSLGLATLMSSTSLEDATIAFQDRFEKPKREYAHTDQRIGLARSVLYSCQAVRPPGRGVFGVVAAAISVVALVGVAGYGAFKARRSWGTS